MGLTDSIRAAIPATCGVAKEVPLSVKVPPVASIDKISSPGANTSNSLPRPEKDVSLPLLLDAPTTNISGLQFPGYVIPLSFPAAKQTMQPFPFRPLIKALLIALSKTALC